MSDDDLRTAARNRLKAKSDFRNILLTWIVLSIFFVAIWFFTGGPDRYFWPIWPILGIGIGVLFSGIRAYGGGQGPITESAIDAEVERMRRGGKAQ